MENNNYILKKINDNQYNFILISTDMSRLHEYISNVETELRDYKIKSFILFDLLLNNNIDDRFYKCYFDGNCFIRNTLSKVQNNDIDSKTVCISSLYYLNNDYLFEDLFFTKEYKKHLFKNLQNLVKKNSGKIISQY
ncbi:type II toxin-antitoxin system RnlB family antitoxin [Flavobacterium sp. MMS24-S5]|uniref:type II toxin-antitoxin system RnlB family antitoxin n=1 Tax=Flavobacterium sp. MMS24-S5 TaxID=3416605 RepID=UPI003D086811